MPQPPPLPVSGAHLERFLLRSRRMLRPGLHGGHLMRRKGQSLTFHDFQHYQLGDDIRHVDWRASARLANDTDLLIKTFTAEEQLHLVLAIDLRPSMWLPQLMPKAWIALWLAEALATIVLRSGDSVTFVPLFQAERARQTSPITLRGHNRVAAIRPTLQRFAERAPDQYQAINLASAALDAALPPTAIWLTLSDYYFPFEPYGKALARRMAQARDGYRWLIPFDFDAWPTERLLIGSGARRIDGPGAVAADRTVELDQARFDTVQQKIDTHKQAFFDEARCSQSDRSRWHWPSDTQPDPATFFRHNFDNDVLLQRIFMRQA